MRSIALGSLLIIAALSILSGCASEADRLYRRAKDAANEEGDYETALRFVDQAIHLNPEEGRYHRRRGDWLEELGRMDEALEAFDTAISVDYPSQSAHAKAIDICIDLGRFDEARERIDHARSLISDPDTLEDLDALQARLDQAVNGTG
ncbi:tetratricopeptide repeat protein, partial [Candidatus Sumerlaeota bacterium]|nr:tetratricopeptide repeat protein [Candidatus Sumerlaeota bacterium]